MLRGDATATGTVRVVGADVAYVWLPGVLGNNLSVSTSSELNITGDLEIVARIAAIDWTAAAGQVIVAKEQTTSQRSYRAYIDTAGRPALAWSANGSTIAGAVAAGSTPPWVDGTYYWIKWMIDVDDGADGHQLRFFWAADQAAEPTAWTQLTAPAAGSGTTSIFASTSQVDVGSRFAGWAEVFGGSVRRVIVRNGIGGSTVLDIDTSVLTDEGATSFTATTGQPVSINRGTSTGYRTEVVLPGSGSRLFNGTADFLEVADNAALRFGTTSGTVWALMRQWATPVSSGPIVTKRDLTGSLPGWTLSNFGAAATLAANIDDGPTQLSRADLALTYGALDLVGFIVDRSAQTFRLVVDGTFGATTSTAAMGDISSTVPVRVFRTNASGYQHGRLYAWGIYPGALTAAQWAALRDALLVPERVAA